MFKSILAILTLVIATSVSGLGVPSAEVIPVPALQPTQTASTILQQLDAAEPEPEDIYICRSRDFHTGSEQLCIDGLIFQG